MQTGRRGHLDPGTPLSAARQDSLLQRARNALRALGVDVTSSRDFSLEEREAIEAHTRGLTAASARVTAIVMFWMTLLAWPTDLLVFARHSPEMGAIFWWRVWLLVSCLFMYVLLRRPWFSSHPLLVAVVAITVPVGASGWLMSTVGGFDSPLSYGIYTVPLLTVLLVVGLRARILATMLLVVAYFICFFAADPRHLSHPFVGTPIIWSVASAITAVIVGHVVYVLLSMNFRQQRRLDTLSGQLQARVSEQNAEIHRLAENISSTQERERSRIAQDLHDELGQMLVALGMEIELLEARLRTPATNAEAVAASWLGVRGRINETHDSLHRVIGAVKPRALEEQGFDLAVTRMVEDLGKRGDFVADVEIGVDVDSFSAFASLILYRIVQEAVTNIARHARAQHARLRLDGAGEDVTLRIADDGVGFDPIALARPDGLGLKGIQERSRLLHGECTILSRPGAGCEIVVRIPLCDLQEEMHA